MATSKNKLKALNNFNCPHQLPPPPASRGQSGIQGQEVKCSFFSQHPEAGLSFRYMECP